MKGIRILICDKDESYTSALVRYLVGSLKGVRISYDTSLEAFRQEEGEYRIALMTEDFIQEMELNSRGTLIIHHVIQLCSARDHGYKEYEVLYKFQSMDEFLRRLGKVGWPEEIKNKQGKETRFVGIYSPIRHELTLPFALLYCKLLSENKRVLMMDLEENSLMRHLLGREFDANVLDCIYEMGDMNDPSVFGDYLESYEGFQILSPVDNPTDLAGIHSEQWMQLCDLAASQNFEYVVELFGELPQGFENFLDRMDRFVILGKPGDYYQASEARFVNFLRDEKPDLRVEEVMLPMTVKSMAEGSYRMDEMMRGSLGLFMKQLFLSQNEKRQGFA